MNISLPSAAQLMHRFGEEEITALAIKAPRNPIESALLLAAAEGKPLDEWPAEDVETAVDTLARIADAIGRARSEVSFYLRFRKTGEDAPDWVKDDLPELARYHLEGTAVEDSTKRLRYRDIIKRLEKLAAEDEARGASEAGDSGLQIVHQPRLFSRTSLKGL
ncbi:phage protein Gp36 family protein [Pseudomonas sp. MRSN 12121]|uniref:phage protein Gp36 family protein n=1 Tax=Pseudomonas sp. MRSN 12121 TaxID=1611770 RepID=UPI0005BEBA26|nr:phage protein Gp36 family protein [Pseudomonas sp. MRSN 12121]AJO77487.1 Mu-like prophage protein gp36 [Pseudomonas sp. MRSN 12121]